MRHPTTGEPHVPQARRHPLHPADACRARGCTTDGGTGLRRSIGSEARRRRARHACLRAGHPENRAEQDACGTGARGDVPRPLRQHAAPVRRGQAGAGRAAGRRGRLARAVRLRRGRHRRGAAARRDRSGVGQRRDGGRIPRLLRQRRFDRPARGARTAGPQAAQSRMLRAARPAGGKRCGCGIRGRRTWRVLPRCARPLPAG